jgi:cbb3-type cytochrome oxidase subunit 3
VNPLTAQAAGSELGWLLGLVTAWSVAVFLAWAVWAWPPRTRARLERAARLPLDDGDAP